VAFYPDYKKLGAGTEAFPYQFTYSVLIKSIKRISYISKPANSVCEHDQSGKFATIFCAEPDREIRIFFRSDEMKYPQLVCAKSESFPGEVACCVSFVPTFEPPAPQEKFEVLEDESPEQTKIIIAENLHFIFLIDRSGSMMYGRIEKAREALILFLRSLPASCKFSVISFGSDMKYLEINGETTIEYNE